MIDMLYFLDMLHLHFTVIYIYIYIYIRIYIYWPIYIWLIISCLKNNVIKVILNSIQNIHVKLIVFSNLDKSIQDIYILNTNPLKFYQQSRLTYVIIMLSLVQCFMVSILYYAPV